MNLTECSECGCQLLNKLAKETGICDDCAVAIEEEEGRLIVLAGSKGKWRCLISRDARNAIACY